jgi:SurA-like protein
VKRLLVLAAVMVVAGCGGDSNTPVAHVGSEPITRTQLDEAVGHFEDEAAAEGRRFPDKGSKAYRTVERQALGLLVYRTQLVQSAAKLGVPVSASEVQQRMSGSAEAEGSSDFARDTVQAQIAYEHIYRRVTAGSTASGREAAMRKWIERMKRAYGGEVSYEAGFGPAS